MERRFGMGMRARTVGAAAGVLAGFAALCANPAWAWQASFGSVSGGVAPVLDFDRQEAEASVGGTAGLAWTGDRAEAEFGLGHVVEAEPEAAGLALRQRVDVSGRVAGTAGRGIDVSAAGRYVRGLGSDSMEIAEADVSMARESAEEPAWSVGAGWTADRGSDAAWVHKGWARAELAARIPDVGRLVLRERLDFEDGRVKGRVGLALERGAHSLRIAQEASIGGAGAQVTSSVYSVRFVGVSFSFNADYEPEGVDAPSSFFAGVSVRLGG